MQKIQSSSDKNEQTVQVQCLSLMTKSIGTKMSPFLPQIVPELMAISKELDEESTLADANELSEACLTTLANIIRRCTRNVNEYVDELLSNSMELISYDPNFIYNDDEDEEMKQEEEDEAWGSDDEFEEEDDDMGDDEDTSWKVRRGAIQVIESIVKTRQDMLSTIYAEHGSLLIDRFKERVNDVKVLLLETFQTILDSSVDVAPISLDIELQLTKTPSLKKAKSTNESIKEVTEQIVSQLVK